MKSLNRWKKHRTAVLSRLLGLYLLLGLWSLTLVGRLVYLQIFKSEEYRLKAEQQHFGFIELSPKRGDILDRHLDELAISVKIDSVYVHPREVLEPLRTARALAPLLEKQEQELYQVLISDRSFSYLARKIPPRQAQQIRRLNLPGVYFQEETGRIYPGRELAGKEHPGSSERRRQQAQLCQRSPLGAIGREHSGSEHRPADTIRCPTGLGGGSPFQPGGERKCCRHGPTHG